MDCLECQILINIVKTQTKLLWNVWDGLCTTSDVNDKRVQMVVRMIHDKINKFI